MANIAQLESQISRLKGQMGSYEDRLASSPSALAGNAPPTSYDISNQTELGNIQKTITSLSNEKLRAQWYPETDKSKTVGEGAAKSGLIGSTLDFLMRPLYGVVGAGKHVLGQGKGSLGQDMADNILRDKSTVGDILRTSGVPKGIAAPLGFALDVALDPITWATMGTSALVPKLAMGAYKGATKEGVTGAIRGLKLAGESNFLNKATFVARYTPFVKNTPRFEKIASAARGSQEGWEKLTGITAEKLVQQRGTNFLGLTGSYRIGLGDIINRVAAATPGGQKFLDAFAYDPIKWVHDSHVKDTLLRSLGSDMDVSGIVKAASKGESVEPFLRTARAQMAEKILSTPHAPTPGLGTMSIDLGTSSAAISQKEIDLAMSKLAAAGVNTAKITEAAPSVVNGVDDAVSLMIDPKLGLTTDPVENIMRIANEASSSKNPLTLEDISQIMKSDALGDTGVKWFDNMIKNIRKTKYLQVKYGDQLYNTGAIVLDKYDQAMGIFRGSKIGASPTGHVNAWVGNLVMRHLALGDIDTAFLKELARARRVLKDKPGAALLLNDFLSEHTIQGLKNYESTVRGTFGTSEFLGTRNTVDKVLKMAKDSGIVPDGVSAAEMTQNMENAMESLLQGQKAFGRTYRIGKRGGLDTVKEIIGKGGVIERSEVGAGQLANELFEKKAARKMFDTIAEKAKTDGSYTWKALDFVFNKMSHEYEIIDQAYKLADTVYATERGLTLPQLTRIRHYIDISPENFTKIVGYDGKWRYTLSADKALELANVTYMNYNAMPAAIRVLRNMPLIGSPFASFMYGMSLKTAQALAYNPAAFTKINFLMSEFGGQKTPIEKKALEGNIYGYLNKPGMMRIPFFDENPMYINLTNMLPYYSMNMFNPSESNFNSDALPPKLVEAVQKSPLMKDPFGSALFDYIIQPLILGEATAPQGQFGQPLFPVDANIGEKGLYGLRTLSEAFTPNVAAYAGLVTPESLADFAPSYRWRQLARAKEGKNQLGIKTKEGKLSRTARTLLSATGIPVQAPMDLSFTNRK